MRKKTVLLFCLILPVFSFSQVEWSDVEPIFSSRCGGCHTTSTTAGVNVSSHNNIISSIGAQYGAAIVIPGNSAASPLYDKISNPSPAHGSQMPLGLPLAAAEITLIGQWIDDGAFLPIELTEFEVYPNESEIILNWGTATETNNDYFIIERSKDGSSFEEISRKDGQGTITTHTFYQHIDSEPFFGENYYRLKQVDFDGTYTYSDIVSVMMDFSLVNVEIAPNPIRTNFTVSLTSRNESNELSISVFDIQGREIDTRLHEIAESGYISFRMDTSDWENGIYFVRIKQNAFVKSIRIVKQN